MSRNRSSDRGLAGAVLGARKVGRLLRLNTPVGCTINILNYAQSVIPHKRQATRLRCLEGAWHAEMKSFRRAAGLVLVGFVAPLLLSVAALWPGVVEPDPAFRFSDQGAATTPVTAGPNGSEIGQCRPRRQPKDHDGRRGQTTTAGIASVDPTHAVRADDMSPFNPSGEGSSSSRPTPPDLRAATFGNHGRGRTTPAVEPVVERLRAGHCRCALGHPKGARSPGHRTRPGHRRPPPPT